MAAHSAYPLYPVDGIMGRVCSRCTVWQPVASFFKAKKEKSGIMNECKTCHKAHKDPIAKSAYDKARYQETRADRIASAKRWYNDHKDERRAYNAVYIIVNAERIKERRCAYYKTHAERIKERTRTWRIGNRDRRNASERARRVIVWNKVRARERRYRRNHPDRIRVFSQIRYSAPGRFIAEDTRALWIAQKGKCYYCHAPISSDFRNLEHMTPIARGGTNWPHNLCWACPPCNFRKSTLTAEEFIARYHLTPLGSPTPCQAGSPVQLSYWPFGCD